MVIREVDDPADSVSVRLASVERTAMALRSDHDNAFLQRVLGLG